MHRRSSLAERFEGHELSYLGLYRKRKMPADYQYKIVPLSGKKISESFPDPFRCSGYENSVLKISVAVPHFHLPKGL